MTNQIQDHDCGTPQGDGCSVCCDQFNEIMNGPKVVYKESTKSRDEIINNVKTYASIIGLTTKEETTKKGIWLIMDELKQL